ncbi:unnamed protein product [Gongylonema pulchrum]|uniref:thioredoxin-dependent peroxiredoxin n=1 Tax=Gongylonema pulchrum TaxID=637853 RepID=A0A3P7ML72_9BILA|nr:unnamed protein product [Gongylonema pulchrum]
MACSTDSHFSHLAWINTPRKEGGLGQMNIPILADTNHAISKAYGVLKEDDGIAYRGLFIIDPKGILRQITINDLPVGRSVDETLRLLQAFQYVDKHGEKNGLDMARTSLRTLPLIPLRSIQKTESTAHSEPPFRKLRITGSPLGATINCL